MTRSPTALVLGLGHFGTWAARTLVEAGFGLTGVDRDGTAVDQLAKEAGVGHARLLAADVLRPGFLQEVTSDPPELAVVCLGEDLAAAVLVVQELDRLGVGDIRVKVDSEEMGRALGTVGADAVIFPDRDAAKELVERSGARGRL